MMSPVTKETTNPPTTHYRSPGILNGSGRNVIALGWVSFLTDLASEMLYPVIPLFVTGTLGASPAILGLIDGIAEGGSTILRWAAGAMSDRFRLRKPFVVAGYTLSAFSKPVMGLAAGWRKRSVSPSPTRGKATNRSVPTARANAPDVALIRQNRPALHPPPRWSSRYAASPPPSSRAST